MVDNWVSRTMLLALWSVTGRKLLLSSPSAERVHVDTWQSLRISYQNGLQMGGVDSGLRPSCKIVRSRVLQLHGVDEGWDSCLLTGRRDNNSGMSRQRKGRRRDHIWRQSIHPSRSSGGAMTERRRVRRHRQQQQTGRVMARITTITHDPANVDTPRNMIGDDQETVLLQALVQDQRTDEKRLCHCTIGKKAKIAPMQPRRTTTEVLLHDVQCRELFRTAQIDELALPWKGL